MRNCPLFRRNTKGATSGEGTAHCSQLTRRVLPVEEKLPLLRSNTKGATSGEETAHSSEKTRRVILVEEDLSTLQK
jgi:ribosomal protein L28